MHEENARYQIRYSCEDEKKPWRAWQIEIEGGTEDIENIEKVVYRLDPTFPDPIRLVTDYASNFCLKAKGWGEFIINVSIHLYTPKKNDYSADLKKVIEIDYPISIEYPTDHETLKKELKPDFPVIAESGKSVWKIRAALISFVALLIVGIPVFAGLINAHRTKERRLENQIILSEQKRSLDSVFYNTRIDKLKSDSLNLFGQLQEHLERTSPIDATIKRLKIKINSVKAVNDILVDSVKFFKDTFTTLSSLYLTKSKELKDSATELIAFRFKILMLLDEVRYKIGLVCNYTEVDSLLRRIYQQRSTFTTARGGIYSILRNEPGVTQKKKLNKREISKLDAQVAKLFELNIFLDEEINQIQALYRTGCRNMESLDNYIHQRFMKSN